MRTVKRILCLIVLLLFAFSSVRAEETVVKGATSTCFDIFILSTLTNLAKTLLGPATITAAYIRSDQSTATSAACVAGTLGNYTSNGIVEISSTTMPGWYRYCAPNAAFASGRTTSFLFSAVGAIPQAKQVLLSPSVTIEANNDKAGYTCSSVTDKTGYTATCSVVSDKTGYACSTIGDKTGYTCSTVSDKTGYTCATVLDKTGYTLTQGFPANFSSLAISASTGRVTVGTNSDKTGYTCSSVTDKTGYTATCSAVGDKTGYSCSTVLDKTGYTCSSVLDKSGYSLAQTFPTNFSNLSVTPTGQVSVATVNDKTGYTATCSAVNDKTGYSCSNVGDKTGYTATCSSVTDKTGYTCATVLDKTGYTLSQSFPPHFSDLAIDANGNVRTLPPEDVLAKNVPASYDPGTVGYRLGYLDAAISSRSTFHAGEGVTVVQNNDKDGYFVSNAFPRNFSLLNIGPTGEVQTTDDWANKTEGYEAGTFGELITKNLDAKITSRSIFKVNDQCICSKVLDKTGYSSIPLP